MDRLYTTNISPADALWTLIQGETQSVKDAFYQRMKEANNQRLTLQQQQYVSKSLKRAFAELEEARTTNMELPDASDLFKLIDKQWRSNKTFFINQRHAGNPPLRMKDRPLLSYQQASNNLRYEEIFNPDNIDQDCDGIASLMSVEADFIKEALDAGLYKQAVTMYLQLLKSMCKHFVEDEHYCYFDDMYSPEYTMQWIYDAIQKHDIDAESKALLTDGHKEILHTECYEDYGYPSYIG